MNLNTMGFVEIAISRSFVFSTTYVALYRE